MSSTSPNSPSTVTFAQFADSWIPEPEAVEVARERARDFGISPASPATGRFLTFLAASVQAQTVVEVGTGTGVSGAALLEGMTPGGVLTSIDTEAEYQRHAREALVSLGHEPSRARLIAGRALDVLPRMSDGAYDVVVVDADRGEYPAMLDQAKRLLRIGGVVAFLGIGEDDMVADPARRDVEAMAVKELAELMRRDADWAATPLAEGNGMLVACLRRRD
ncbi:MAG: class I SAM-dependent methyltransferase [Actinomycetota bacterium]|jgi:predicted O-methyltransferase YrrM